MIKIGGNAQVTAIDKDYSAGVGGSGAGEITIGGSALVTATGGTTGTFGGAGIGGNYSSTGGTISIGGNAQVTATGGNNSAGIGGGHSSAGGTITISGGVVIARTSGATSRAAAIGGGGAQSDTYAAGKITISGGFVVAQSANPAAPDIGANEGYTGGWDAATNSVTISGGSVYAANALFYPAPTNGSVPVFPLYAPATLGGSKVISILSPVYTAQTISKRAVRFLTTGLFVGGANQFPAVPVTGLTDLFPTGLSATLWLPEYSAYTGITVNGTGNYSANVTASLAGYVDGGANRLLR